MDTLTSLKVFREVVELKSFNAAAKKLGISTAMASKHIANLESIRQTRLLNRTSRNISLTETGKLYYSSCQEALDILDDAENLLGQHNSTPHGTLRITAPQFFSNPDFARIMVDYQYAYPKVKLELFLENQTLDLVSGQYDLALRVTNNPAPTMIARPIVDMEFIMVGSPHYFLNYGYPTRIQDLNSHNLILPAINNLENFDVRKPNDIENINAAKIIRTNDTSLILQLTRSGFGLAYLPYWLVEKDLEDQSLETIQCYTPHSRMLYAIYKNRQFLAPKIRTFIDFLVSEFEKINTSSKTSNSAEKHNF